MKWHKLVQEKNRKTKNTGKWGGLEKQKAEQDCLIFIFSTRNENIHPSITDYIKTVKVGIDSS